MSQCGQIFNKERSECSNEYRRERENHETLWRRGRGTMDALQDYCKEVPVTQMNQNSNFISNQLIYAKGVFKMFQRNLKNRLLIDLDGMT